MRITSRFFHLKAYDSNVTKGDKIRHFALGLILESRVDIGCDTDFAMYYSLYIADAITYMYIYILLYYMFKS